MIPEYMDKKHDYSFTRDRQLQNKLLAADEFFDVPKQTTSVTSSSVLRPSNLKDSKFCEVTGWCPDDRLVLRRPEHDTLLSKSRTGIGGREYLLTRDRSRKDLHDLYYAFHHYPETHRYIEQYRREHTCSDSTNSATTRNEFLELQRFYAYRSQSGSLYTHPTAVGYMPQSQTHTPTRRENSNINQHKSSEPNLRSASRYKLSPSFNARSEPELSKESDQTDSPLQVGANSAGSTSKMTIHAVTKNPIQKVPAKVSVPANQSLVSPGHNKSIKAGRKTGSPKTMAAAWESNVGAVRTLDTLTCVARPGDKPVVEAVSRPEETFPGSSPLPEVMTSPRVGLQETRPGSATVLPRLRSDSENSEAISFDRLSTACLAADVSLKPKPRLEPSCTYHVFPSEDMLVDSPTLFTSSMLWNPAKSTLERRSHPVVQFEPGFNSPFKNVVNQAPVRVPDKEQMVKEFINDLKPLNLSFGTAEAIKPETPVRGLKGNTTKPDLPPDFELQGVSHTGRPVTHQEPRQRKGRGKLRHREGERKTQSAHSTSTETETCNSSRSLRLKPQDREILEGIAAEGSSAQQQPSVPYFKFWNSSLPSRANKGETHVKRDSPRNGEMNLRKIAELMLNNEELPQGELEELIQQRANKSPANAAAPSIASGDSEEDTAEDCDERQAPDVAVTWKLPPSGNRQREVSGEQSRGNSCSSLSPPSGHVSHHWLQTVSVWPSSEAGSQVCGQDIGGSTDSSSCPSVADTGFSPVSACTDSRSQAWGIPCGCDISNTESDVISNTKPDVISNTKSDDVSNIKVHDIGNIKVHDVACGCDISNTQAHDSSNVKAHDISNTHDINNTKAHDISKTHYISNTKAHYMSNTKARDISNTKAHDINNTKAHTKAHDISNTKAHTKAHDISNTKAHDISNTKAHDISNTKAHDISNTKAHIHSHAVHHCVNYTQADMNVHTAIPCNVSAGPDGNDSRKTAVKDTPKKGQGSVKNYLQCVKCRAECYRGSQVRSDTRCPAHSDSKQLDVDKERQGRPDAELAFSGTGAGRLSERQIGSTSKQEITVSITEMDHNGAVEKTSLRCADNGTETAGDGSVTYSAFSGVKCGSSTPGVEQRWTNRQQCRTANDSCLSQSELLKTRRSSGQPGDAEEMGGSARHCESADNTRADCPRAPQHGEWKARRNYRPDVLLGTRLFRAKMSHRTRASARLHGLGRQPGIKDQDTDSSPRQKDDSGNPMTCSQYQLFTTYIQHRAKSMVHLCTFNAACTEIHPPGKVFGLRTSQRNGSAVSRVPSGPDKSLILQKQKSAMEGKDRGSSAVGSLYRSKTQDCIQNSPPLTRRVNHKAGLLSQHNPHLIYRHDVGDMMVVGNDCRHRADASPVTPSPVSARGQVPKDSRHIFRVLASSSPASPGAPRSRRAMSETGYGSGGTDPKRMNTGSVRPDRAVSETGYGSGCTNAKRMNTGSVRPDRAVSETGYGSGCTNAKRMNTGSVRPDRAVSKTGYGSGCTNAKRMNTGSVRPDRAVSETGYGSGCTNPKRMNTGCEKKPPEKSMLTNRTGMAGKISLASPVCDEVRGGR